MGFLLQTIDVGGWFSALRNACRDTIIIASMIDNNNFYILIPFVHKNSGSGSITVKQVEGKIGESRDDLGRIDSVAISCR